MDGGFGCSDARNRRAATGVRTVGDAAFTCERGERHDTRACCCHLPMQKVEKIAPSRSSLVKTPVISPKA